MLPKFLAKLRKILRLRELAIELTTCPACRFPFVVRLASNEIGVRCPRCRASAITLSLIDVLCKEIPLHPECDAYELSAAGPLASWLGKNTRTLQTSEWFEDCPSGIHVEGVLCQDVQRLSFPNACFDLCTSTEVFEHVENDDAGFREIFRVLRPGGHFIFTVPLHRDKHTQERAYMSNGRRIDLLPPAWHADRRRGENVFVFRDYGEDILDRLLRAGFQKAEVKLPSLPLFGFSRPVLVASKPRS